MRDRQFHPTDKAKFPSSQRTGKTSTPEMEAREALAPQSDPLLTRIRNPASVSAQAAMLNRAPSLASRSLLQLQRQHGNRYVQRVLTEHQDKQDAKPVARPQLRVKNLSLVSQTNDENRTSPLMAPVKPDKSINEESEMQDQSASLTTLVATANGVRIEVEAQDLYSSTEYPNGFKWTQIIDTNVPLGGTTSPYVDPRPNDDTKPFYYTDAEHAAFPTTFHDRPSRRAPATGTTYWNATLGLNGVDETTQTVTGFDYLRYGFSIDSSGTVTVNGPLSGGGANHRSVLASEFPSWTFI